MQMDAVDLAIVVVYFVFIVALGCWAGLRKKKTEQADEYFLAGKSLTWPVIGLALFATNISTVHLVSLAQEGYANGLAYGNFEWMAPFTLIILALFFAPFYIRSGVATLPDYLERRYSRASRDWLAFISIISAIFIHIGFSLYAGAVVLEGIFGLDKFFSIVLIAAVTGLYTIVGGLMAVVLTESVQTIILLLGAIILTVISYVKVGGYAGMADVIEPVKFTIMRSGNDPSGLSWYSVLLGYPIIGIWYWCTDQTIVQRVLGAKDENHARVGPIFAGFIKVLPVFIFVLPGLICLALVRKELIPALPIGEDGAVDTSKTYAHMITHLLPVGLRGLVAAALMAALMSTVSGALNSVATLFTYDLYQRWAPQSSQRRLVFIGRVVTFVGMVLAVLWSPLCGHFATVFQGINTAICYIAPPITVVFLAGVFWKQASAKAAFITMVSGSVLGLTVFLLDWFRDTTGYNIPFMIGSFYLACICAVVMVVVSLLCPDEDDEKRAALTWRSPLEPVREKGWPGLGNYKFLAGFLAFFMVILYVLFTFLI